MVIWRSLNAGKNAWSEPVFFHKYIYVQQKWNFDVKEHNTYSDMLGKQVKAMFGKLMKVIIWLQSHHDVMTSMSLNHWPCTRCFLLERNLAQEPPKLAKAQVIVDALRFVLASKCSPLFKGCSHKVLGPQLHEVTVPQGVQKVTTQHSRQKGIECLDSFPSTGLIPSLHCYWTMLFYVLERE